MRGKMSLNLIEHKGRRLLIVATVTVNLINSDQDHCCLTCYLISILLVTAGTVINLRHRVSD